MVEVEMAHRDDVDRVRVEAGRSRARARSTGPRSRASPGLVVEPIADPGLDEDAAGRRLDQEAVQRLEQAVLGVDLGAPPSGPRGAAARARTAPRRRSGTCPPGRGRPDAAAQVAPPVDGVVQRTGRVSGTPRHRQRRRVGPAAPTRAEAGSARRPSSGAASAARPDRAGTAGSGSGTGADTSSRWRSRTARPAARTSARTSACTAAGRAPAQMARRARGPRGRRASPPLARRGRRRSPGSKKPA